MYLYQICPYSVVHLSVLAFDCQAVLALVLLNGCFTLTRDSTVPDYWFDSLCIFRYKFDDERVTKEDTKRALDEQYGGEEEVCFLFLHPFYLYLCLLY